MREMLDAAESFDDLAAQPGYRWFLQQIEPNHVSITEYAASRGSAASAA